MLTNLELFKENGYYYLHATYQSENDREVYELDFPKLYLGYLYDNPIIHYGLCTTSIAEPDTVDLGFGRLIAQRKDGMTGFYTRKTIKEKTHEMTLEEIEKKLGYKVKIVTKEKKKND